MVKDYRNVGVKAEIMDEIESIVRAEIASANIPRWHTPAEFVRDSLKKRIESIREFETLVKKP